MRLPPIDNRPTEWPSTVADSWQSLTERVKRMEAKAGQSDAFERMLAVLRSMVSTARFDGLVPLLRRRLAARALTSLWLNDRDYGPPLLNAKMLDTLIEAQQPRLTRLTLVQLLQLYFRHFDQLDTHDQQDGVDLREKLQRHLLDQLQKLPEQCGLLARRDVLSVLKTEGSWLLSSDGPLNLVQRVRDQGGELAETFSVYSLKGFDSGRYGDICRAHYYLETLRGLAPGQWDDVLDELLKPSVSKAPYESDKRIGHAALEIMIDRVTDDPSDNWQNFILTLAGDPRIASSAANFREWWQPLGEERISKVRGWLSRKDLRLFLQAVEQYGIETRNEDLQRMFPDRKIFLEGLFKLKLIRNTRLLLGQTALRSVRKILDEDVKTNFAQMDGQMADKAVIYLDCGDFHLVEGSHNFRIWTYLASPSESLRRYERSVFSHDDLIHGVPWEYKKCYPQLPLHETSHKGNWQAKVIRFLGEHGIGLDVEKLFTPNGYKYFIQREGIPYVNPKKVVVPKPVTGSSKEPSPISALTPRRAKPLPQPASKRPLPDTMSFARDNEITLPKTPASQKSIGKKPTFAELIRKKKKNAFQGRQRPEGVEMFSTDNQPAAPGTEDIDFDNLDFVKKINALPKTAREILDYFSTNPGDMARHAGNVLGIEVREVKRALYGPLKELCIQDRSLGWTVLPSVSEIVHKLFSH